MRSVRFSAGARRQIREILAHSETVFGLAAAHRYRDLITLGAQALAEDPDRIGVKSGPRGYCLFHLRHAPAGHGVAAPRHLLVFRFDHARIEVIRLFHDAMDLPARLADL